MERSVSKGSTRGVWLSVCSIACAGALLGVGTAPAYAGRCSTGLISGGLHGDCPSVDDPRLPQCPAGSTRVVYDLDKDFPPEPGTTSTSVIHTTPDSPCAGASVTVPMSGYVIGCWFPPDPGTGCRTVKVLSNGSMCLHLSDVPLGCGGPNCENLSVEQVALSNAGAADRFVCPPVDPSTSCRSARLNGEEKFRLWIGGLCTTQNIAGGSTDNACVSQWGATYYGYGPKGQRHANPPPGWYDWASGAFKVEAVAGRPQCDGLSACTGENGGDSPWEQTIVGVPRPDTPPPCLGTDPCNPATCVP